MKCLICNSYSFYIICTNCQENFLKPSFYKREITKNFFTYSFYKLSEIEDLINSKYELYGDKIFTILAKNSFSKFSKEFNFDEEVYIIPIDDHVRHKFSHTAILAKAMKAKKLHPKYNCLKAQNIIKYAGKDLEFRKQNPRNFKVKNLNNKKLILVDDLITTGQTIKEAKKILKQNNNEVLFSLTLADAKY